MEKENALMRNIFYDKLNITKKTLLYSDDLELIANVLKAFHKLGITWRDGNRLDDIVYLKEVYEESIRYCNIFCMVIDFNLYSFSSNAIIGYDDSHSDFYILERGEPIEKDLIKKLAEIKKEYKKQLTSLN